MPTLSTETNPIATQRVTQIIKDLSSERVAGASIDACVIGGGIDRSGSYRSVRLPRLRAGERDLDVPRREAAGLTGEMGRSQDADLAPEGFTVSDGLTVARLVVNA